MRERGMAFQPVFAAMFRKAVTTFRRYAFNTISEMTTIYIIFVLMFYGAKAVGGPVLSASHTLEAMVVGYFIWIIGITSYSNLSWDLTNEAQMGTLEQLYLSPVGFRWVSAFSLASNAIWQLFFSFAILLLTMVTTGRYLHLDLFSLMPLLVVTMVGMYGFGYLLGGIALIYKRVQAFLQIVQFVLVAFLMAPVDRVAWFKLLPLAMGNRLAQQVMIEGRRLWELAPGDLLVLVAVSAFYLVLGLAVFDRCERVAKRAGLLGQY